MINKCAKYGALLCAVCGVLTLSGCGLWPWSDDTAYYTKVNPGHPLRVPPGLTDPISDPTMNIPEVEQARVRSGGVAPESVTPPVRAVPRTTIRELPHSEDGVPYLVLHDNLADAWQRTGLALERSGFTISDRDRTRWLYSIVYLAPTVEDDTEGFFAWVFGDEESEAQGTRTGIYHVSLVGAGEMQTRVVVLDDRGNPVKSPAAEQILSLLAGRLNL